MKKLIFDWGFSQQNGYYPTYDLIPYMRLWYTKHYFLETGVDSPAAGFKICWLNYKLWFVIQQGY